MGGKPIFFTSDLHIGHENVIKFDSRPFKDLTEMADIMARKFNYLVPEYGITYFLGDVGLCSTDELAAYIKRLNGTKILILGNHDGKPNSMYNAGFDCVLDRAQIRVGKHIVTMSHCPLQGVFREDCSGMKRAVPGENWHGETKHGNKYSWPDFGQWHLHGHIHSSPKDPAKEVYTAKQLDVGVRAHNYFPVRLSQIESWIATGKFPFKLEYAGFKEHLLNEMAAINQNLGFYD